MEEIYITIQINNNTTVLFMITTNLISHTVSLKIKCQMDRIISAKIINNKSENIVNIWRRRKKSIKNMIKFQHGEVIIKHYKIIQRPA